LSEELSHREIVAGVTRVAVSPHPRWFEPPGSSPPRKARISLAAGRAPKLTANRVASGPVLIRPVLVEADGQFTQFQLNVPLEFVICVAISAGSSAMPGSTLGKHRPAGNFTGATRIGRTSCFARATLPNNFTTRRTEPSIFHRRLSRHIYDPCRIGDCEKLFCIVGVSVMFSKRLIVDDYRVEEFSTFAISPVLRQHH